MTRNPHLPLQPSTGLIRVAVVSDDLLLRGELSTLLGRLDHIDLVARGAAQVVLCDVGLDRATVDARLAVIRELAVPAVALVNTGEQVTAALAAGARGALLRKSVGPQIGAVVSAIHSGLTVVDTELARHLHAGPAVLGDQVHESDLTGRELQVAQLLSQGLSNKLIADRLGISDHTAKFHVNGVMTKLNASTRTEAVVEALRRGLIQL